MRGWRNLPDIKKWTKLGYTLESGDPHPSGFLFRIIARAPRCSTHRIDLIVHDGKVGAVLVCRAPVSKRHTLWREDEDLRVIDWSTVPAAWFPKKIEEISKSKKEVA